MKPQNFVFDEQTADDRAREVSALAKNARANGAMVYVKISRPDGWYRAEVTVYAAQVAS